MALIKLGNFERCCWPRSNKVTSIGVAAALLTTINASSGHQDFTAKYIIWRLSSYRCSFTLARTSSFLTTYLMLWLHALAVAFLLQWIDRNPFQSLKIPECYNALPQVSTSLVIAYLVDFQLCDVVFWPLSWSIGEQNDAHVAGLCLYNTLSFRLNSNRISKGTAQVVVCHLFPKQNLSLGFLT